MNIVEMLQFLGAIALAFLAAFGVGRWQGKKDVKAYHDNKTLETMKEYEDAKEKSAAGGAAWADRLRKSKD